MRFLRRIGRSGAGLSAEIRDAAAELGDQPVETRDAPGHAAESTAKPGAESAEAAYPEAAHDADAAPTRGLPESDAVDGARRVNHSFEPDPEEPDPTAGGRPVALRLAGLHLRTGLYALARAELEALAGRDRLDDAALLDLAEVRWRTGDLTGAGDAASALLAQGSETPLALLIAAESVAAAGRPGEARRLASRTLELVGGPLDPIFAGMPRAAVWPAPAPDARPGAPVRRRPRSAGESAGAPSTASEAFAGGRAAMARNDANRAALLLGVAMRLEPRFAEDILRALAGRDDQPMLALVRGDALRLLGREAEALVAFDRARGHGAGPAGADPHPAVPGLFDDDPALAVGDDA